MFKLFIFAGFLLVSGSVFSADSMSLDDRMQFADGLFARDMFELAVEEYTGIIEADPGYKDIDAVYYRLGDSYRFLGDLSKAERNYAKVFKDFQKGKYAFQAGLKRADIFISEKRFAEGAELYSMVLALKPPEPIASACHYFLGDAYIAMGKTNEAERAYEVVVTKHSASDYYPFALIRLAETGAARGEKPESVLKYYRAAATNNIAPSAAAEALYQMGRIEYLQQNFEASTRAFESLAGRFPDDPRTRSSRLDAAWAQYNAGLVSDSLNTAAAMLKKVTDNNEAAGWEYLKANAERALGKYEDAAVSYTRIIQRGGGRLHVYTYERALSYFARGDFELAVKDLKSIESEADIREDVFWMLARSLQEKGDDNAASQYFSKLAKDFPDGRFAPESMFRLASIQSRRKEHRSAASIFSELAGKYPENNLVPRSRYAEGLEWLAAGDAARAIGAWDAVISAHAASDQYQDALLSKAVAQINLKRFDDAGKTIDIFLKQHPASGKLGEALFWHGVVLSQNGDNRTAEKSFAKSLELKMPAEMSQRARAYRAVSIYRSGDEKRAAEELQKLKDPAERVHAGRNIFVWLTSYWLENRNAEFAVEAGGNLLALSAVPIERQEAGCLLGRAYLAGGQKESAVKAYTAVYKEAPDSIHKAEAGLILAEESLRKGDVKEAEKMYQAASRFAGGDDGIAIRARSYMGLGRLYQAGEDYARAARFFMSVAVLFDDDVLVPEALRSAAESFDKQGLTGQAKDAFAELKQRYPDKADGGESLK